MELSLDARSRTGIFLLVLIVVLSFYLCKRRGSSSNDHAPSA